MWTHTLQAAQVLVGCSKERHKSISRGQALLGIEQIPMHFNRFLDERVLLLAVHVDVQRKLDRQADRMCVCVCAVCVCVRCVCVCVCAVCVCMCESICLVHDVCVMVVVRD